MRTNHALVVLLFTIPLTAQEDALPVVTPRAPLNVAAPEVMLIATAVEPIRELQAPTLAEAARANDYTSFDTLYREAKQRGEPVAQFETLHELWTYNVTDPIGAFYGAELHDKLARAYPGFAQYIADHSIVDSRGNVFYPTAETRAFVLSSAMEGRAPRVLLAGDAPAPAEPAPVAVAEAPRAVDRAPVAVEEAPRKAAVAERPAPAIADAPPLAVAVAEPAPAPVVAQAAVAVEPLQAVVAQQADTAPAPVQAAVVDLQPQPAPAGEPATSRGILLIVMGLLGVGLLAVMFRTPQESLPATIIVKPAAPSDEKPLAKPVGTVEPLKRPDAQQHESTRRASGSRH